MLRLHGALLAAILSPACSACGPEASNSAGADAGAILPPSASSTAEPPAPVSSASAAETAADAVRSRFRALGAGVSSCRLASSAAAIELIGKNVGGLPVLAIERGAGDERTRIVQRVYNDDGTVARWSLQYHPPLPDSERGETFLYDTRGVLVGVEGHWGDGRVSAAWTYRGTFRAKASAPRVAFGCTAATLEDDWDIEPTDWDGLDAPAPELPIFRGTRVLRWTKTDDVGVTEFVEEETLDWGRTLRCSHLGDDSWAYRYHYSPGDRLRRIVHHRHSAEASSGDIFQTVPESIYERTIEGKHTSRSVRLVPAATTGGKDGPIEAESVMFSYVRVGSAPTHPADAGGAAAIRLEHDEQGQLVARVRGDEVTRYDYQCPR